ncbi:MAG: YggS family pyridoxal phosphate-dependent enzyme [Flavobacteriales bacterium]|nr:YggS family pyridoxal phosphate-dependent enzyme [Flavobacteriales bacterium]
MGSLPDHVKLIAVSKTRSVEEIMALYRCGHRAFGENYPQELRHKQSQLPADIEWHFIGHLQTNKVKYIAPFVHMIHSVDSERLLDEINKRAAACDRTIPCLLEVHIAKEESKHGFSPSDLMDLLNRWDHERWDRVRASGLMGMATMTDDRTRIAQEFSSLRALYERIVQEMAGSFPHFKELSMGMSADADIAVRSGSTMVRMGTALFGAR